jgi:predicted alpha/beta hydrolase family esterase
MVRRVFIVHGWGGRPDKGWLKWLAEKLKEKGYKVFSLKMPNPGYPKIKEWVYFLKKQVGKVDNETYFIGHSIGCQTILRFIETLPKDEKVGGIYLVAGWLHLNLETDEEKEVAGPWTKTPLDLDNVKNKIKRIFALFSDNDPYVPISDSKIFKEKLGAKIIIEKGKGHYIEDRTKEIPILLNEILKVK